MLTKPMTILLRTAEILSTCLLIRMSFLPGRGKGDPKKKGPYSVTDFATSSSGIPPGDLLKFSHALAAQFKEEWAKADGLYSELLHSHPGNRIVQHNLLHLRKHK